MTDEVRSGQSVHPSAGEEADSSYRERLEGQSLLADRDGTEGPEPNVEALEGLVKDVDHRGATYQSVAVAAVQILERALTYEREAAEAALSLGQQEKMQSMVATAERAVSILRNTLNAQGNKVMHLCTEKSGSPAPQSSSGQPWWFALTDALEVLEEGTDQMASLTTGQPSDSPARALSQHVAQLLRGHHDALLLEADEWIS